MTKDKWFNYLIEVGCIACLIQYQAKTPCCIHHLRVDKQGNGIGIANRSDWSRTIGLCPRHHQGRAKGDVSVHGTPAKFKELIGDENYLLDILSRGYCE